MTRNAFARRPVIRRVARPVTRPLGGLLVLGFMSLVLAGPARAQPAKTPAKPQAAESQTAEPWPASTRCRSGEVLARDYNRCLYEAISVSEKVMEAALANAFAVIEARADLLPAQRNRWRILLDEAQIRYGMYRNFDCQSVAPFEGPRGIGNFEQRALCLIANNERRAEDLRRRYGEVPKPAAPAPAVAVENIGTRPATWLTAVARPLD
ncbi:lysozyme inhibitor LprI family protein [Xanthobacter sp. DSM 24535]|uniref:lysozyme inhibitor LprI family protein n=1 Tax=Roseixanthobacter psychrophilus TaxID=3119917 RepID=UPI0037267EC0